MDAGSYDNVEFPIRKPSGGTSSSPSVTSTSVSSSTGGHSNSGTWPGNSTASSGRIQIHHATKVDARQTAKLATVEESTTENDEPKTHSTVVVQNSTVASSTTTDSNADAKMSTETLRTQPSPPPYISTPTLSRSQGPSGEQFDRRDLTPGSQGVVDKAYTDYKKHHRFNNALELQGLNLKDQVCDMCRKPGESVSYEQLLQGMLVDGERLLLTGNWLHFTNVEFLDVNGTETVAQPLGNGRACLTSRALLLLCAEGTLSSNVQKVEEKEEDDKRAAYRLAVKKYEQIYYRSVPLTCVRSVELNVVTGTSAETKLTMRDPLCWGICGCFGIHRCNESWKNTRPRTVPISRRTVTLGVNMPPWGVQTTVVIHLLPEMSVVVARDLVACLQTHAPSLSTISTL